MALLGLACMVSNLSVRLRIRRSRLFLSAASADTARPRNKRPARTGPAMNGVLERIRLCAFWFLCVFIVCLFVWLVVSKTSVGLIRLSKEPSETDQSFDGVDSQIWF